MCPKHRINQSFLLTTLLFKKLVGLLSPQQCVQVHLGLGRDPFELLDLGEELLVASDQLAEVIGAGLKGVEEVHGGVAVQDFAGFGQVLEVLFYELGFDPLEVHGAVETLHRGSLLAHRLFLTRILITLI